MTKFSRSDTTTTLRLAVALAAFGCVGSELPGQRPDHEEGPVEDEETEGGGGDEDVDGDDEDDDTDEALERRRADAPYVDPRDPGSLSDDEIDGDTIAYALKCKEELGIRDPLPDLNCLAGTEVPITVDGAPLTDVSYAALSTGESGCDNSQWLERDCYTYDIMSRIEIQEDVEAILNCRQKFYGSRQSPDERIAAYEELVASGAPSADILAAFRHIYEFDDLGFVMRNTRTGKSCFFTSFGVDYYGGWLPAPDKGTLPPRDEVYAERLPEPKPPESYPETQWYRGVAGAPPFYRNAWFSPRATANGGCVECHNRGAFKHSPFIDQVKNPDGSTMVPPNPADLPYLPVGRAFQQSFLGADIQQVDTLPINGEPQTCTACHALHSGPPMAMLRVEWALGIDFPAPSQTALEFPQRAWMPLGHGLSEVDYESTFGAHVDRMLCCLENPTATGCRRRSVGPTADDVQLDENGRLSRDGWQDAPVDVAASCILD